MTFYLKYRPRTLDELDSQSARESLKKIVASGKMPHAFLFSGPKGIGKTSAARILAKIVNCESRTPSLRGPGKLEPCNQCGQCISISKGTNIDVIELDAASHRGIDDVRSLREAVKLATARAKNKVYIIDEAHMLTLEASNALLKTLEEPPEHVMFILATTNPEKLIATIRSRCTHVVFKKAKLNEIVRSLERVAKDEKIKVETEGLELIAKHSDGSFRDAVKLLETLQLELKILELKEVEDYLFNKKAFDVEDFLSYLSRRDVKKALYAIENAVNSGASLRNVTEHIITRLRSALMNKMGLEGEEIKYFDKEETVRLIELLTKVYGDIPNSYLEQIPLELAVIKWCGSVKKSQSFNEIGIDSGGKLTNQGLEVEKDKSGIKLGGKKELEKLEEKEERSNTYTSDILDNLVTSVIKEESENSNTNGFTKESWLKILTQIRPKNTSTEALLRAAKPLSLDGGVLTLGVYYKFHKERLETNPHRDILEDVIEEVFGSRIRVVCTLTEPPLKSNKVDEVKPNVETSSKTVVAEQSDVILTESDSVLTESEDEDIIKVAKEIFGS
ncbi:DNA polymerase III, subunit gamma and tau [Candidatus Woesebacteria bacterium RIFCSPHIGHO2_01_FULL_39_17]|uniref:DNA polymerase III subunit gamma/tau n=2 Tax=Candidatus Woeseibacteriota TaxID=1752722 RepID=A0A0G0RJI0_9BACT|nr:MAG: polymerase III, subunit gamma and tau protein [Microgenomates group bacterium GW2011_GWC1_38_12]KKQ93996.1 MAG: polymerase III gamma/tau subunit protein [Candidatus Woesebacteria bacterium GW2011_GWB1_39_10b]KKR13787.1 MAG: polymerase III gamma/tau subunit protein [Candidatus Woesebacteria bacterium GW2011_GWA1_39_21b]OGM23390.1 MAG: DNA polymerase III, subunit gamma and tau [Candidatus Woesebacteria bacterium RIFCSPHIGHO2_01_FULL_39_17]